jgi:hypothetical protein
MILSEYLAKAIVVFLIIYLVLVYSSSCASLRKDVVEIPLEDAEMIQAIATAEIAEFVEHYKALYAEGRPPSPEEYGYYKAKYESAKALYREILSRAEVNPAWYKIAAQIGVSLFKVVL